MREGEQLHPETVEEWHSWLVEHAATSTGVWLVGWKKHTGRPRVSYEDSVLEALAFGWIDSQAATLDDDRSMQRFTPRRPKSGWSRPNKERVARLQAEKRMTPAGQRMVDLAHETGTWSLLDDAENLVIPDDLTEAFVAHPGSREQWDAFPPSARRVMLAWITTAKWAKTRAGRVEQTADKAARGERAHP